MVWDLNGSLVLAEGKWDIGLTPPFQTTNWREADTECKNRYMESPSDPKKWVHDPFILGNDQPFCKGQKQTPGDRPGSNSCASFCRVLREFPLGKGDVFGVRI